MQKRKLILPAGFTIERTDRKLGRNDPCPCGSGKKFKKCCSRSAQNSSYRRDPDKLPKLKIPDAEVKAAATSPEPPADKNATAIAMVNAGVAPRFVWAYLESGAYVTELNRNSHSPETLAKWDAALTAYNNASDDERKIMLVPATPDV